MNIDFMSPTITDQLARQLILKVMSNFDVQNRTKTNLIQYDWTQIWRELVNTSIYHTGADFAEIGSTWLESLVSMNSLRPFSEQEMKEFGGRDSIFPSLWQDLAIDDKQKVWGIPFRADLRVIFYWDDMLEKAGVDAEQAFVSAQSLHETLEKLQESYPTPWAVVTMPETHNTVYNLSSWIRGAGSDFLSAKDKKTAFGSSESLAAIKSYFELYKFMPHSGHPLSDIDAMELFANRNVAVTVCGYWQLGHLRGKNLSEETLRHVRAALMPGPAFVGGTTLVVWQHARNLSSIIALIKAFYEPEFLSEYCRLTWNLPVKTNFWTEENMARDPNLRVYRQAIETGMGMPVVPLWGMIEDRLTSAFGAVWRDIYSTEFPPTSAALDDILNDRVTSQARRLDVTLAG